jgi:hypothetical protein
MYNKNEKIFDMKRILFLVLLLVATTGVYGQKFAVKSNLLYDATATINLGVEVGLAKKWSLDLSGNYNGWKFGDEARMKHWLVQNKLGHLSYSLPDLERKRIGCARSSMDISSDCMRTMRITMLEV